MKYLNESGISLSVAAFLADDQYDHEDHTISATGLIKPLRQLILSERIPESENVIDISKLFKSKLGNALHDGIEKTWTSFNYIEALTALGYSENMLRKIVINPGEGTTEFWQSQGKIPIFLERRSYREIAGVTISGKFDFLANGRLEDFKSTSTYVYSNQSKIEDYQLQGSIYRWLNPTLVTEDVMAIQYLFTDFSPHKVGTANYPSSVIQEQLIPLLSIEETESYILNKLTQLDKYKNADQSEIPYCTDKELWRKEPVYKYYKNPEKKARSTKNFDNYTEALLFQTKQGNVGEIVTVPGEVVACKYCPAFSICTQKNEYIASGALSA